MASKPKFNAEWRKQLSALGVSKRVADALERRALPAIAAQAEPVKLGDIRDRLNDARKHAKGLLGCLERMKQTAGGREASLMLFEEHTRDLVDRHVDTANSGAPDFIDPDEMGLHIERFIAMSDQSLARLKGKQSRHRIAHPYPIRKLDAVLLEEWVAENEDQAGLKPYPFPVSRSGSSLFFQIAAICYAAAGHPTLDPDRAIRTHLEEEKTNDAWLEELIESGPDTEAGQ